MRQRNTLHLKSRSHFCIEDHVPDTHGKRTAIYYAHPSLICVVQSDHPTAQYCQLTAFFFIFKLLRLVSFPFCVTVGTAITLNTQAM
jgi:hypothetical protein